MPDTPFKSMTRDREEFIQRRRALLQGFWLGSTTQCERCGGILFEGSWPWCKGNPEDHDR